MPTQLVDLSRFRAPQTQLLIVSHFQGTMQSASRALPCSQLTPVPFRAPRSFLASLLGLSCSQSALCPVPFEGTSRLASSPVSLYGTSHSASHPAPLKGIVVILSNPAIRVLVNFLLGVIKPPQPIQIVKDEEAAIKFLSANCQIVQPWRQKYEERKGKRQGVPTTPSTPQRLRDAQQALA